MSLQSSLFRIPKWVLLVALLVPLASAIPLLFGYTSSAPPENVFMGFDFIDDFHYYANYIYAYQHVPLDLFIENRMTTEPQSGVFFFPLFWIMGLLANAFGIPLAFALVRLIVGIILFLLLWRVLGHFFNETFWRNTAFLLCALGSGIGWIFWIIGNFIPGVARLYSTDLTYSLGYNLFGYLTFPLAIAGEAIFLAMLLILLEREKRPVRHSILFFAGLAVLLFFVHPISFLTYIPVLIVGGVFLFFDSPASRENTKWVKEGAIALVLAGIPILAYLLWAFSDNVFRFVFFSYGLWLRAENPFWWFIGYGFLLALALYGIRHFKTENAFSRSFFWAWILTILVLSLNPWKGLRFQHALFIPLVILATNGLHALTLHLRTRFPQNIFTPLFHERKMVILLLLLTIPSILLIVQTHTNDVTNPAFHSGPYLSQNEIDAFAFLATQERGNVLSAYKTGNNLAWRTPHATYLGHWNQTIDVNTKKEMVEKFYSNTMTLSEKKTFLENESIAYIVDGPPEKEIEKNGVLVLPENTKKLFSNEHVTIYRVVSE